MSKTYFMRFGSGDPRTFTGLSPSMLIFVRGTDGATISAPSITETLTGSGIYQFTYGTTQPIAFLADAVTTSPGTAGRYVSGSIDPADRADEYGTTLVAIGNTLIFDTGAGMGSTLQALGNTMVALGTTSVALGTTSVALGITSVSWGLANNTAVTNTGTTLVAIGNTAIIGITNTGTTLVAIGNTAIAYGGSIYQYVQNEGSSLVAIGNTSIAYGASIYQYVQNEGTTLVAVGNTLIATGTTIVAIGNTSIALGQTILAAQGSSIEGLIGTAGSTFGGVSTDPIDLFGYVKRIQENLEGNSNYTKSSGAWTILSRGSSSTLANKTITNGQSTVIKV